MSGKQTLNWDCDEALVLFEFLTREIDERNGIRLKSATLHDAELWALNLLQGHLERNLVSPFEENYLEQVSQAREALIERCGRWPD
jgi:hypothetical protein